MDVSALRLAFHSASRRADGGDFLLRNNLTRVLRTRSLVRLRALQADDANHDETTASSAPQDVVRPCLPRPSGAGYSRIAIPRSGARLDRSLLASDKANSIDADSRR